jgi:uncharacterized protein
MTLILHPGTAEGAVLLLDAPLSFWGAFDSRTGVIIDVHHPQHGRCVKDKILMMAASRGSGSASGGLAEAIRNGAGPAGIILVEPDINLAIGAEIAETLYGKSCPVMAISPQDFSRFSRHAHLRITLEGVEVAP